ncbi:hypothetical protein BOTCAL_0971g00010 [Botryotinia calthae]|uniref:Uncharacterized protein n=1 Tax=Botryotinia calthae TaxID=38488 RepID=A0A4Y8CEL4_9HELO|nr:hypothetical protein BOTCAL_0971g00010 [Botryotinia calthae]
MDVEAGRESNGSLDKEQGMRKNGLDSVEFVILKVDGVGSVFPAAFSSGLGRGEKGERGKFDIDGGCLTLILQSSDLVGVEQYTYVSEEDF